MSLLSLISHLPIEARKSLKYSVFDGLSYEAMLGLTQQYVIPFALALRATTTQIGLLASIPYLAVSLSQLAAPYLSDKAGSRKGIILPTVLMHALIWLPILFIPYLFRGPERIWWLIGFFTISMVLDCMGDPAWASMMADLVPAGVRGRYFGLRGKICGLVALISFVMGGGILHIFASNIFLGFCILFGIGVLLRLLSWHFLRKMHEPPISQKIRAHSSLLTIVRGMRSSNLGRFTIYVALMNFATFMAAPFFAVYMLRDLGFSNLTYVVVIATATLSSLMFLTYWGRRTDQAGNIKILRITSVLVSLGPLLWMAGHQLWFLIPIQVLSGFAWSGFNLASTYFLYDATSPENRTRCIALASAMNGIAICLGSLLGGFLASHLPTLLGSSILALFLISGLLRGVVAALVLSHVREVRQVKAISTAELLLGKSTFLWSKARRTATLVLQPALRSMSLLSDRRDTSGHCGSCGGSCGRTNFDPPYWLWLINGEMQVTDLSPPILQMA